MKKVFFSIAIILATISVNAQSFGLQVGANLAFSKSEFNAGFFSISQKTDPKFGFILGLVGEVPITGTLNFRPEFNFLQKGYKYSNAGTEINVSMNYIEVPLNVEYSLPVGAGKVFFGAGPNFGFGVGGKSKQKQTGLPDTNAKVKFDGKANTLDNNIHLKTLDFGANIIAGYKFAENLVVNLNYTFGFLNLSPVNNVVYKNTGSLAIKVGYMLGSSK